MTKRHKAQADRKAAWNRAIDEGRILKVTAPKNPALPHAEETTMTEYPTRFALEIAYRDAIASLAGYQVTIVRR